MLSDFLVSDPFITSYAVSITFPDSIAWELLEIHSLIFLTTSDSKNVEFLSSKIFIQTTFENRASAAELLKGKEIALSPEKTEGCTQHLKYYPHHRDMQWAPVCTFPWLQRALTAFGEDVTWVAPTGLRCLASMQVFSMEILSAPWLPCSPCAGLRSPFSANVSAAASEIMLASKWERLEQILVEDSGVWGLCRGHLVTQWDQGMSQCPWYTQVLACSVAWGSWCSDECFELSDGDWCFWLLCVLSGLLSPA